MVALEMDISGITREVDFRYCIANELGCWHTAVWETPRGDIDGFVVACSHPAMTMLGPCLARTEEVAAGLIRHGLDTLRGRMVVFLVPADRPALVHKMYSWGARNCELHFCQVRGEFQPFRGISMPTFLPETG
jgi:hypothetical protein